MKTICDGRRLSRRQFALAAGAGIAGLMLPRHLLAQSGAIDAVVAATAQGRVRGLREGDSCVFRGIPYAHVTGRWQAPQPVAPWADVRDAFAYGARSWQVPAPWAQSAEPMSNQCQVLNVWTPALDNRKRPVMVWCHGGGFMNGSANTEDFAGQTLNALGAVVVTHNHRLGLFGSLTLPGLSDERYAGADVAGMLDIVAVLEWVRDNIAAFGGDPDNVTIFGQSGGGGKVIALMAMPAARGLFHRAIVQSGALELTAATPDQGLERTSQVMQQLGINSVDELLAVSDEAVLQTQEALLRASPPPGTTPVQLRPFAPVLHPRLLPEQPFLTEAPATAAAVPLLIGATREESRAFFGPRDARVYQLDWDGLAERLAPIMGEDTEAAIALYRRTRPSASPSDLFFAITTAQMYGATTERAAALKAVQGGAPVFRYEFRFDKGEKFGDGTEAIPLRAAHGTEVSLVFGHPDAGDDVQAALNRTKADQMSRTWVAFARTGDPNNAAIPEWPPYNTVTRPTMIFDGDNWVAEDPDREERNWWQQRADQSGGA